MAAKPTSARAKAVKAAPAKDLVEGAETSSTQVQETAGIAPAAGAAVATTQGPTDGPDSAGQALTVLPPVAHQLVKTQSLVALELAPVQTPEASPDDPDSSELESLETAQTPPESAPPAPVILGAWSLPAIDEFPATLTLTNHTASRFVVLGKGIPVGQSMALEVTEQEFSKLAKSLRGHVQLDKWDNVRGLQVAHESID